jgi:hypothetical protein
MPTDLIADSVADKVIVVTVWRGVYVGICMGKVVDRRMKNGGMQDVRVRFVVIALVSTRPVA